MAVGVEDIQMQPVNLHICMRRGVFANRPGVGVGGGVGWGGGGGSFKTDHNGNDW